MTNTLPAQIATARDTAMRSVAPLWPLKHFVAVNPFLGVTGQSFAEAADTIGAAAGARMVMPRSFYADALEAGRITTADLAKGLTAHPDAAATVDALAKAALQEGPALHASATVADLAGWGDTVVERISLWAQNWFDEGQAGWTSPWAGQPAYAAWKAEAALDRTPELLGLKDARAKIAALSKNPDTLLADAIRALGLSDAEVQPYLTRLTHSIAGWAGVARYRLWQAELYGNTDSTLSDLISIRLAWEVLLKDEVTAAAWDVAKEVLTKAQPADPVALALHVAYEAAWQDDLIEGFKNAPKAVVKTPLVQAAFCIDVRSEVFRRALEVAMPEAETIGFAGFFGAAIDYQPLGRDTKGAQCPVLLTPSATIPETAPDAAMVAKHRTDALNSTTAWSTFKGAAVSSFAFVETLGLGFAGKLASNALGFSRPAPQPRDAGLGAWEAAALRPDLSHIPTDALVTMGKTILTAMSMNGPKAPLIMLAGHGSTSANNPHATGLDCGACGGHTGEANARVAAAILNTPEVRVASGLEGSWVIPALHDTTTDAVTLYDTAEMPTQFKDALCALQKGLKDAGQLARAERGVLLHLNGESAEWAVPARANDWAQTRPEWGLAGCAAFIAAPRSRTQGRDLKGRSFLHSYIWEEDEGFGILELIMTAPLVVASWINLQYYGSTVDNRAFGSGNKTLHNVAGTIGVLEGNGGDLRSGLPMQSLHDGERFLHEPMRLNAVIEAPLEAMSAMIERHDSLRELLDNDWLHLFAMNAEGKIAHRYQSGGEWVEVADTTELRPIEA